MKINLPAVLLLMGGAVLLYSGVKNANPRDVIMSALNGKFAPGTPIVSTGTAGTVAPLAPPTAVNVSVPTFKPGTTFVSV